MTGIILAGGRSSRMGRDKSLLPWNDSDLMHTVIRKVSQVCDDMVLVSNQARNLAIKDIQIVQDIIPNMGPLGGIHAGLTHARYPLAFVTACDMPYVVPQAVDFLLHEAAEDWDVVIPTCGDQYEPMFCVYRKTCIPAIETLLKQGGRRIVQIFSVLRVKHIDVEIFRQFDPKLTIFTNINTMEEYEKALQREAKP
jgi:molybdopterin-guanine dinucleotide biosynthesis protein A